MKFNNCGNGLILVLFISIAMGGAFLFIRGNPGSRSYYLSIINKTDSEVRVVDVLGDEISLRVGVFRVAPSQQGRLSVDGYFKSDNLRKITLVIDTAKGSRMVSCSIINAEDNIKKCLLKISYSGFDRNSICACDDLQESD